MKNNLFTTILSWVLVTSLVLSVVFSIQFFFRTREMRMLQGEMARYQNTRAYVNMLVNDILEYYKTDPGIAPVLETIGIKLKPGAGAAALGRKSEYEPGGCSTDHS